MHLVALRAHLADPALLARGIGTAARNDGITFGAQSVANRRTDAAHSSRYVSNSFLLCHDRPLGFAIAATHSHPAHRRERCNLLLDFPERAARQFARRNV